MSTEQPRVEVFSRNNVTTKIVDSKVAVTSVSILSLGLAVVLVIVLLKALAPFFGVIGWVMASVTVTLLTIGALYLVVILAIDVRRRWYHSTIVHLGENGVLNARTGKQTMPLALPAPVTVTEEKNGLSDEDREVIERSKVLTMYLDEGKGMHAIEKELGIPYNKVRDWCNTAKEWRASHPGEW